MVKTLITLRLTRESIAWVEEEARKRERSRAFVVENLVENFRRGFRQ